MWSGASSSRKVTGHRLHMLQVTSGVIVNVSVNVAPSFCVACFQPRIQASPSPWAAACQDPGLFCRGFTDNRLWVPGRQINIHHDIQFGSPIGVGIGIGAGPVRLATQVREKCGSEIGGQYTFR